jgi:hypothetical protein
MGNVIIRKRGLLVTLVIATLILFIGLVWLIARYLPLNSTAIPIPSATKDMPRVVLNCASPVAFWKEHPEYYPAQLVIGGQVYKAADLDQIFSDQIGDLSAKIKAQLAAVYLNILSGADQSYIETTIFEAYGWLVDHPVGSQLTDTDQADGTRLFNLLDAYNLGLTGVAPCDIAFLTQQTEKSSDTPTVTFTGTFTPSPTETFSIGDTPAPSSTETNMPFYTVEVPTRTSKPTTTQPIINPPTSTHTPEPSATTKPTDTPIPSPSDTPEPTKTPPPSPTITKTPPPSPTNPPNP